MMLIARCEEEASEELSLRLDEMQLLAATAAHELNNALTPVSVATQQLARIEGLPPNVLRYIATITEGVNRTLGVVQALQHLEGVDLKRWPGGRVTLDLAPARARAEAESELLRHLDARLGTASRAPIRALG